MKEKEGRLVKTLVVQTMYTAVADYLMLLEDQKLLLVGRIDLGGSKRIDPGGSKRIDPGGSKRIDLGGSRKIDPGGSLKSTSGMVKRPKTQSGKILINLASD